MIRSVPALVAMSFIVTAAAAAQALYTPPEGDFAVAFPAAPTVQVKAAKRMADVAVRRYVDQEQARALVVSLEQYPQGVLPPSPNAAVYDRVLRSRADDGSIELVSTRAARLAGRPSLEGTFKDIDGNIEITRVLMLEDRIFKLTYATAESVPDPTGAEAFFASFKISAP